MARFLFLVVILASLGLPASGQACKIDGLWLGMPLPEARRLHPQLRGDGTFSTANGSITILSGKVTQISGNKAEWEGHVLQIGDTRERIVQVLGKPDRFAWVLCGNDTSRTYIYERARLALVTDRMLGNAITMITLGADYPKVP